MEEPTREELETCPFCEGREALTPPETLALGRDGDHPDTPGWTIRVVPNLYPALERQEVVVHSPRHARSFAELADEEIRLVAAAWQERARAAAGAGFPYVHALVNEGRFAGASRAHSHSQLVWLREPPPAITAEATQPCGLCALVDEASDLVVRDSGRAVSFAHPAGRVPYELVVAPRSGHGDGAFEGTGLAAVLDLLRDAIRRLRAIEGPVPWNAWLHAGEHWHLEVVPRLTVFAGLELGAGIYVNVIPPDEAAAALRAVGQRP